MLSDHPDQGIVALRTVGLLKFIVPELDNCSDCKQSKPWHLFDVFYHTVEALRYIGKTSQDLATRLAILYHDTGKPFTKTIDSEGICHFHGHTKKSAQLALSSLARLRFSNDTIVETISLVTHHDDDFLVTKPHVKKIIRKLYSFDTFPKLVSIRIADVMAQNPERANDRLNRATACLNLYHEIMEEQPALKVTDLAIDGYDIMNFGYKGKEVGEILNGLLSLIIDEVIENDKGKLISLVNFKRGNVI
jgi:tRNA nucleotidyltransferase (CCA-adding enzyme)